MTNNSRGFTLLEVLIALAIFALISLVCYRQIDASARASARIEQKYIALWIASNTLDEMFIGRNFPATGNTRSTVDVATKKWAVETRVTDSGFADLNKIETTVYSDERASQPVLTLTRFIGKK